MFIQLFAHKRSQMFRVAKTKHNFFQEKLYNQECGNIHNFCLKQDHVLFFFFYLKHLLQVLASYGVSLQRFHLSLFLTQDFYESSFSTSLYKDYLTIIQSTKNIQIISTTATNASGLNPVKQNIRCDSLLLAAIHSCNFEQRQLRFQLKESKLKPSNIKSYPIQRLALSTPN